MYAIVCIIVSKKDKQLMVNKFNKMMVTGKNPSLNGALEVG